MTSIVQLNETHKKTQLFEIYFEGTLLGKNLKGE